MTISTPDASASCLEASTIEESQEESPTSLIVKAYICHFYEVFKVAGLDDETIKSMCSLMSATEVGEITKVYPQLKGHVKFRSAPDKPCVEEFLLEK